MHAAPPAPSVQRLATALSGASFGVLGACLTLPGTLLPLLVQEFGIRLVEAGSMFALQGVGYLLAVLVAGPLIGRVGLRAALVGSLLTSAGGFAAFGLASGWLSGAATILVAGLGFGLMEVATNTLLIIAGGARRANVLNLAHLFFGIGSFTAPALVARAVAAGTSWRALFAVAGGLAGLVGVGWRLLPEVGAVAQPAAPTSVRRSGSRSPLALLLAVLLAMYVGAEIGIGSWLTKYLTAVRSFSLTEAGGALSLYWLGLAAGRLALSLLAHRVRDEAVLLALTLVTVAALASALLVASPALAVLCFGATGLGFSGIFPAVMALGGRHHLEDVAGVTSVLVAGAGIGGIVIPWVMSAIADGLGLTAGMGFYLAAATAMVGLTLGVRRQLPRRPSPHEGGASTSAGS